jgi:serine/threonine-protein kinase RsbT
MRSAIGQSGELSHISISVRIASDKDVLTARQKGRALAIEVGFSLSDSTLIATAISELARNIVAYARQGEIVLETTHYSGRLGITVVARDDGPGIPNIDQALRDGYSTSGSLGLGLPNVRRLVEEFEIVSEVGRGTTVTIRKWKILRESALNLGVAV